MAVPTVAAAEQALKKVEDQLICAICLETYHDPKLLSCFHVFCSKCLEPLVKRARRGQGHTLQCPNCRQTTTLPQNGVPGLQGAFHVHHLFDIQSTLKKVKEVRESHCDKCLQEKATNFCCNCGQFICPGCTKVHQTWEELAAHEVITIQQLTSDATKLVPSKKHAMPCFKHPAKELDLFCDTCDELICRDCIVRLHRDHVYDLVGDAFPKHKEAIDTSLQPVQKQLASVSDVLKGLDIRCSQINKQRQDIKTQIQRSVQQLHDALEARKQELIKQLEQVTQQKLKNLEAQRDHFHQVQVQLKSCCDFVQESLRTGGKAEILAMKKPVMKQMGQMTASFTPHALGLSEQADMKFSYDQPKVIQSFHNFGSVYSNPVCPEKCYVSSHGVASAVIGERLTTTLFALDKEGKEYQEALEDVNCKLVFSDASFQVVGTVKRLGASMYEVSYQPLWIGQHYLHIQVEGRHIQGSPFSIMVQASRSVATTPSKAEKSVAEYSTDSARDCEDRVRELLCSLPGYQVRQDYFLAEYQKKYGKMTSYYGHSKLSGLLESFTGTLDLEEPRGPTRLIKLLPIHILTHELTLLLLAKSGSLPISQIVPAYAEHFGKKLVVSDYGFSKLIRVLEAMPETIRLTGSGPGRIAHLKKRAPPRHR